ncbi:hypothetical protein [Bacillus sp. T3]|uniref:hypothetical protein n=1 Tax=Bacillus sp. T3 TaxID=467262 RepID=UPI00298288D2|nr:hypothetical protein [Bacillus sp. T3]
MANDKAFAKAVELIEQAKKPVFFIGGGVISSRCGRGFTRDYRADRDSSGQFINGAWGDAGS